MADFCMPSLGADMRTGTLVEWKVKPGDHLKRGDIIADVETDKGIMEIEVFEDCVIDELLLNPDTEVPVGTVMARIHAVGVKTPVTDAVSESLKVEQPPIPSPIQEASPVPETVTARPERLRISPLARKLAAELGVDLAKIQGTGPDGVIQKADIEQAAALIVQSTPAASAAEDQTQPLQVEKEKPTIATDFQAGMRQAIAAAMSRSNRDIPHYYLETQIDLSTALKWLESENQKRSIRERLLPVVLLIKAVARSLTTVPELNGYWIDNHLQVQEAIHVGFAISLRQGGLITPAIHHADMQSLDELMVSLRDLIERTRAGRLRSSEMTDATITLTSLGDMGVQKVFGVIYPPQVALIGFGKISEQPWAEQGMVGVRSVVTATLSGDHRATDGMIGARFLQTVSSHLQTIENLNS